MLDYLFYVSALESNPYLFGLLLILVGASFGSFINVLVIRLPLRLDHQWRLQSLEYLEQPTKQLLTPPSICFSRSRCQNCQNLIRWYHNIPLLSYIYLRGQCSHCGGSFSSRYFIVEFISSLSTLILGLELGISIATIAALFLTYNLILLSFIDLENFLLPDEITIPLLWVGLMVNANNQIATLNDALWGAVFGYLSLWIIAKSYYLITKKEGMGYGDFKLFAAIGAWFGWQLLPFVILLSTVTGIIFAVFAKFVTGQKNKVIPFGPYLAISAWCFLMYEDFIIQFVTKIITKLII